MSNQLHDSEGGPLFKMKHCNLIMCGLIKGPCVHPQLCTTSSTWLKSPREDDWRRKEEKKGAELSRFLHTAASSPRWGTRPVSGFSQPGPRGNPGNTSDCLPPPGVSGQRRLAGSNWMASLSLVATRDSFHSPF